MVPGISLLQATVGVLPRVGHAHRKPFLGSKSSDHRAAAVNASTSVGRWVGRMNKRAARERGCPPHPTLCPARWKRKPRPALQD